MSTAVVTNRLEISSVADGALKTAGVFWFAVTVIGQWIFVFYILAYYGTTAARGNYSAWNKTLVQGWEPGATLGNACQSIQTGDPHFAIERGSLSAIGQCV